MRYDSTTHRSRHLFTNSRQITTLSTLSTLLLLRWSPFRPHLVLKQNGLTIIRTKWFVASTIVENTHTCGVFCVVQMCTHLFLRQLLRRYKYAYLFADNLLRWIRNGVTKSTSSSTYKWKWKWKWWWRCAVDECDNTRQPTNGTVWIRSYVIVAYYANICSLICMNNKMGRAVFRKCVARSMEHRFGISNGSMA